MNAFFPGFIWSRDNFNGYVYASGSPMVVVDSKGKEGGSLPRNKAMTIVHWGVGVMLFLELLLALVLGKDVTVYDATP